eukprot:Amastigsp_a1169_346.p3 type:complete len:167 gc:universal Amastigsp_a1169_346:1044-544(-)
MIIAAAAWARATQAVMSWPMTYAEMKPPTNASPAPFVSTMSAGSTRVTGYFVTTPLWATTVSSAPCVMTTMRSRDLLVFSCAARARATAPRSSGLANPCTFANSPASVSFPKSTSTKGMSAIIGSLKNCTRNGAERLKQYTLFCAAAWRAMSSMASGHTVRGNPDE